ncbi:TMV resistance protein N-like [Bidens hawaiensis]|uniref:TMV resistance protein N-like n=1 Tax=Bidens hawaiensis TaxID=980011 RepID=UPI00404A5A2A
MCNIVVLELIKSKLERLWGGIKSLKKLRILDVSGSRSLTKTGNLSGLENLEELNLCYCRNLKELHSSIGDLKKLVILNLSASMPLKRTPWEMIGKLPSLQKLTLGNYDKKDDLKSFSDDGKDPMVYHFKEGHVTTLELCGCNLSEISLGGVASLASLKHLKLLHVNFSSHCDILLQLHQLNTIEFDDCDLIESIPNLPANITSIIAFECESLVNLPCNISELKSLTMLSYSSCPKLGSEDPHFLLKVTGLTNLSQLTMRNCIVSQVPSEIGNLESLKRLDLSSNPFSSLPDTLSNLSQLLYLNIDQCKQLRLLPLLPPNLTCINARWCDSLDVTSSAFQCIKMYKESSFSNRLMMQFSVQKEVPDWCSYRNRGDVLSFVAPLNLEGNICGIIVCANFSSYYDCGIINPAVHNKTKNTSHRFKAYASHTIGTYTVCMCVMWYPLDDTTLLVEPGDSVEVVLPQGSVSELWATFDIRE